MCEPITITSIVMGAATAISSTISQKQAADAQEESQERASKAELDRVASMQSSMRLKERQEKLQAAQKLSVNRRNLTSALATATTASGETGVGGSSVNLVMDDMTRAGAEYGNSIRQNLEFADKSRQFQFDNVANQSIANLININQPIAQVDYFGNLLKGASTGLSAYGAMDKAFGGVTKVAGSTASGLPAGATDLYKAPDPTAMYA